MKKFNTIFLSLILLPLTIFSQTNPKVNPSNFSFAVLGDRTGSAEQPIFEQVLVTVKSLNPNFVVNVGDLIEGYSQNNDTLNNQWNFIFENLQDIKEKFFFTPGNHDALDSLSLQIYLSRIGYKRSYYSFSVGKNHFVVLDNARQEKIEKIDSTQIQWLITELSKYKKSDNIFCFMHRSFWKDAYTNNKPDTFHKIFTKYGVDYVFSGHDHFYCQLIWDGITYTQVGPSGSRYKVYYNEAYGAFQNFVLVSVKNNKVQIKLYKPDGTELEPDYVTFNNIRELQNIEQAISITPLAIGQNDSVSVIVNNVSDRPFITNLTWQNNSNYWHINPQLKSITVESKSKIKEAFYCKVDNESIYPLPQFSAVYPYALSTKTFKVERKLPIHITAECYKTNSAIAIDGKLMEKVWQNARPLNIFASNQGDKSETDPWEVYFTYDENNLYIAGTMVDYELNKISTTITKTDDKVYNDDHINIILQPKVASDTYYQFFINANGTVLDRVCYMIGKDSKKDTKWNSEINVKAQITSGEKFTGWTVEMALPLKQFGITGFSPWGFNLVRYQTRTDKVSIYSIPFEHNPKTFATLIFVK